MQLNTFFKNALQVFSGKLTPRYFVYFIIFITFLCYHGVLKGHFVWDDHYALVTNNNYRGFSYSSILWMFTTFYDGNYHPLSWASFALDYEFWGMNPPGYHATSLFIHCVNAMIFFYLSMQFIRTIFKEPYSDNNNMILFICAAFGTLFFATHPLRVENVAWLSARADLLCAAFYMLSISFYIKYVSTPSGDKTIRYFLSVFFCALSLLSRAWGMTLPIILIIMDLFPLKRIRLGEQKKTFDVWLLIEKIPFLVLSISSGVLAFLAKSEQAKMPDLTQHGIIDRISQSVYGLCFYVWKTLAPLKLSPLYRLENNFNILEFKYIFCIFIFAVVIFILFLTRKRSRGLTTLFGCYAVIVSPVLGLIQAGPQIAADRYTYISTMPFGILASTGFYYIWIRLKDRKSIFFRIFISLIVLSCISLFFTLSFRQVRIWQNDFSLWTHVISIDPECETAYWNRGIYFRNNRYFAATLSDFSSVIRLNPDNKTAYNDRGVMKYYLGDLSGALNDFNIAIKLAPNDAGAYANRGIIYATQKEWVKAIHSIEKAIQNSPENDIYQKELARLQESLKNDTH
jgi:hypothetical protein